MALSSSKVEFKVVMEGTKEALYLRGLLCSMIVQDRDEVIPLFYDNQGAIKSINNDFYHSRTNS